MGVLVKVEVDLFEIDSSDLKHELERRGYEVTLPYIQDIDDDETLLIKIYETKKLGGNIDTLLNEYIYKKLGVLL
jgi:hypothetical protein